MLLLHGVVTTAVETGLIRTIRFTDTTLNRRTIIVVLRESGVLISTVYFSIFPQDFVSTDLF